MIVMSLIVILASIGLAIYTNSVTRAKESVLKEDLFRMRDAIDQYYSDKGEYPTSLQDLVSQKYLRSVPVDPFTNSADTWREVPAEPDPGNPTAQPGVYDVRITVKWSDGSYLLKTYIYRQPAVLSRQ